MAWHYPALLKYPGSRGGCHGAKRVFDIKNCEIERLARDELAKRIVVVSTSFFPAFPR